jgi:hydrogenase expression/formation protein HypC
MCLAVPGRVTRITGRDETLMAQVDFAGVTREVCLQYVPEAEVGDWVVVHVGFALQRLDEQSARETLALFDSLAPPQEEFGDEFGADAGQRVVAEPELSGVSAPVTARADGPPARG